MNSFRYEDRQWPKTDAKEYIFSLIRPESYILDLGCWTGRLGEKLRLEKKCEIVGVDINQEALSLAKKRLNYVFQLDLDQPEFLKKVLKLLRIGDLITRARWFG